MKSYTVIFSGVERVSDATLKKLETSFLRSLPGGAQSCDSCKRTAAEWLVKVDSSGNECSYRANKTVGKLYYRHKKQVVLPWSYLAQRSNVFV